MKSALQITLATVSLVSSLSAKDMPFCKNASEPLQSVATVGLNEINIQEVEDSILLAIEYALEHLHNGTPLQSFRPLQSKIRELFHHAHYLDQNLQFNHNLSEEIEDLCDLISTTVIENIELHSYLDELIEMLEEEPTLINQYELETLNTLIVLCSPTTQILERSHLWITLTNQELLKNNSQNVLMDNTQKWILICDSSKTIVGGSGSADTKGKASIEGHIRHETESDNGTKTKVEIEAEFSRHPKGDTHGKAKIKYEREF